MAELSKAIARLMEDRGRALPQTPNTAAPPALREILDGLRTKVTPGERPLIEAFTRQLFERVAPELLVGNAPAELVPFALGAFQFITGRGTEEPLAEPLAEPRLRIFDPDLIQPGHEAPRTVIETLLRDRPFIVDTIQECLRHSGIAVQRLIHPVFAVERGANGRVLAIGAPTGLGRKESFVHVEVERVPDPDALAHTLTQRLADLILATDDYQAMRARIEAAAEELRRRPLPRPWNADIDEVAAFLDWLGQKSFVFLGYREYHFEGQGAERTATVRPGSGLGILRHENRSTYAAPQVVPEALRRRLNEPPLLIISKTNAESPIHRRAHMDYVGIKEIDAAGVVAGERRLLGLFTSKAYAEETPAIPLLRRKLAALLEAEEAREDSHDYKAIVAVFTSIPRVELLASSAEELRAEIRVIRTAEGNRALDVLCRPDASGRGVFVTVFVPRERFSDDLYRRVSARLTQTFAATAVLDERLIMEDSEQVRMHFYLAAPVEGVRAVRREELRTHLAALLRTWDDRLHDALREQFPREQARPLSERYTAALSNEYKASTDILGAVEDIRCLEALLATRQVQVDLTNPPSGDDARFTAVKLYLAGEDLILSDFLPVLENLGLRVFAEDPLDVALPEVGRVRIHTFLVQDATGARLDLQTAAPLLKPALLMLHGGRIENDRLNALILGAGLEWQQVDMLRAYVNHGVQIGTASSRGAIVGALVSHPHCARLLWQYFAAKFDPLTPAAPSDRLERMLPEIEQLFVASLDAVQSVAEDRILRALYAAFAATVRTNYFSLPRDRDRAVPSTAALAMKLESGRIAHLPRPQPLFAIYVHAPHVEGIHLRSAKVARGGIRLSDRPDDFRTEILDLMRTQTVKNAVIVPAGAKGGFIVKRRAAATPAAVVLTAYRTFINALLDVTDNVMQGRVVPPAGVLIYDDPDPYLVVAADKGTATFSDVANELAAQRQFWLGDAFASGGTHGYDHKKEAITARGAWECVRRHFSEMGRDVDQDQITVIGIGDMSGDVFGNGALLSRRVCLRAAFNHQHIFLDPNPDPARSFAERERLFTLPRSTWADYNAKLISSGGGVFARNAKTLALPAPARTMLGLHGEHASGEEVVRAILTMEADLLWNGGIGTYVKASDESHTAVGDSANDSVRINATELRVKVVAEGGNLGFTQRARVEYALRGGRINTDAIDNSAGVDMSDHEVNLKIVLAPAVDSGQLAFAERNRLLAELAPEVTRRVLSHNRRQAWILSLDQLRSQTRLNDFRELMLQLETDGVLDRHLEALPDRDALRNRRGALLGLTRPELAVLLAYSKLTLQHRLLESALPEDPFFERYLRDYFPDVIEKRFAQGVRTHRLRREIIAVELANALTDTMGAAFIAHVVRDTGNEPALVAGAWAVAASVGGATELWAELMSPQTPPPAAARCWFAIGGAIERAVKWIVETQPADTLASDLHDQLVAPVQELLTLLPQVLPAAAQVKLASAIDALASDGAPRALAERIVPLDRLAELCEIAHIAADHDIARTRAAEVYYRVGDAVDLDWVRHSLSELPAEDRWERRALEGLREGLMYARRRLTHDVLATRPSGSVEQCLREYVEANDPPLRKLQVLIDDVKSARRPTLAALLVVMRALGRLVGERP